MGRLAASNAVVVRLSNGSTLAAGRSNLSNTLVEIKPSGLVVRIGSFATS